MSKVIQQLKQHASDQPDKLALILDDGELGYKQLVNQVSDFATTLQQQDCHCIAYHLDNGANWVIADLAALMAGITAVPIPGFFSDGQIQHVLAASQADIFITDEDFAPGAGWTPEACQTLEAVTMFTRPTHSRARNIAKITFTSGSTGEPKGVQLSSETLDAVSGGIVEALSDIPLTRHVCLLPLATLLENIAGLYAPLMHGLEVRIASLDTIGLSGSSLDIEKFANTIKASSADSMILVPQLLTAVVTLQGFEMIDTRRFKMIAVGGGRISQHLLDQAAALSMPVYQGYGLSECCSVLTLNLPEANRPGSVGKPLPHAQIRVSANGELQARGSNMIGYLDDTTPMEVWYNTGDLGYIDEDGYVFVTGRKKHLFITAFGRNVNPEWVESALTQQPAIAHALVYGESRTHNLALLWLRFPQTDAEIEMLVETANKELPGYAGIGAYLVMTGDIPAEFVTANGRLKRQAVIEQYQTEITDHYDANPSHLDKNTQPSSTQEQPDVIL